MTCEGPGPPNRVYIYSTDDVSKAVTVIRTKPAKSLHVQRSVKMEIKSVVIGGIKFYVKFYKPTNFDARKKYRVVFNVYGGPTKNKVTTKYQAAYAYYFAGHYQNVVVMLDARGTPGRSDNFHHAIYKKLGDVDVTDTIAIIKRIRREPWVKATRMAIYGASYGGYQILHILQREPKLFRAAVAAASVTDWAMYDSAYTERFMGLYDKEVYTRASLLPGANNTPNNVLLLIHGLSDYNVLIRHHWALVSELNRHHVRYKHYVKPGQAHKIKRLLHTLLWFRERIWRRRRC